MAKRTKTQEHVVSVIAHAVLANEITQNVKGMEGSEAHYLKSLSAGDRALVEFFHAEIKRIPWEISRMMEKDQDGPST